MKIQKKNLQNGFRIINYTKTSLEKIGEVANGISSNSPNSNQGRLSDFKARIIHIGDLLIF